MLTDSLHPLIVWPRRAPDLCYYPKGYLPRLHRFRAPHVITVHDTIVQFWADNYPAYRSRLDHAYWTSTLAASIRGADTILTVSQSAKAQILEFCERHRLGIPNVTVTYEASVLESAPELEPSTGSGYVLHLASHAPHKRTTHLLRWWQELQDEGRDLPPLRLIGDVDQEGRPLLARLKGVSMLAHQDRDAFVQTIANAMALLLPSEIEGFGLPALEGYYLGTPVCYVQSTSVEEILGPVTKRGRFALEDRDSFEHALAEVLAMPRSEIMEARQKLRSTFSREAFTGRVLTAMRGACEASVQ